MPLYPHVIRQQYLHVEVCGTERDGLALQSSLADWCQYRLMPAIERIFERYASQHEHLYIERLEIDAGATALESLESDLAEAVAGALEKALEEQRSARKSALTAEDNVSTRLKTGQQNVHDAFIYFLATGRLPWSFCLPADKTLEQVVLDVWRETKEAEGDAYPLNTAVLHALGSITARQRLVRQFSTAFLGILLSRFSSAAKTAMDGIFRTLWSSDKPSDAFAVERAAALKRLEQNLWETALSGISIGKVLTPEQVVAETWKTFECSGGSARNASPARLLESYWPEVIRRSSVDRIVSASPEIQPAALDEVKHSHQQTDIASFALAGDAARQPLFSSMPLDIKQIAGNDAADIREGLYIDNAGLVILHPFLPRFFEALGIAAEDVLLQPERALCLLHFLITGQSTAPEYALVLPKILCNVPLDVPVEPDINLTEAEHEEAAALLEAVVRHWEVLRNTSADGLRGTFLLRAGKVSRRGDGDWLLQVEAQSFDILLDQLPWGIGMIKLPWMEKMLWVEWR